MRLTADLADVANLTPTERDSMYALMAAHYAGVRRAAFESDLAEKRWVICLHDPSCGRMCGFSTQTILTAEVDGEPVKALFSGDTIIDRDYWGDHALTGCWGRLALALIDAFDGEEFYWFLISQGYKTYRFLPVFFHEFYPRHDVAAPRRVRAVIDALAGERYPDAYDPVRGVVRAGPRSYRLRPGVAEITPERLRDRHVRFFHDRNPGHACGDELCCLAPLTRANFTPAAYRVISLPSSGKRPSVSLPPCGGASGWGIHRSVADTVPPHPDSPPQGGREHAAGVP
jgi:hypothetical protein